MPLSPLNPRPDVRTPPALGDRTCLPGDCGVTGRPLRPSLTRPMCPKETSKRKRGSCGRRRAERDSGSRHPYGAARQSALCTAVSALLSLRRRAGCMKRCGRRVAASRAATRISRSLDASSGPTLNRRPLSRALTIRSSFSALSSSIRFLHFEYSLPSA